MHTAWSLTEKYKYGNNNNNNDNNNMNFLVANIAVV